MDKPPSEVPVPAPIGAGCSYECRDCEKRLTADALAAEGGVVADDYVLCAECAEEAQAATEAWRTRTTWR